MEKISRIVRGNARMAAVDNKNAAPARPGMPTFGRPAGESTAVEPKTSSTASRAVALHNANTEMKKALSQERVASRLADDFFMSRVRRPEEQPVMNTPELQTGVPQLDAAPPSTEELVLSEESVQAPEQPKGYTPRGSFVDVRA